MSYRFWDHSVPKTVVDIVPDTNGASAKDYVRETHHGHRVLTKEPHLQLLESDRPGLNHQVLTKDRPMPVLGYNPTGLRFNQNKPPLILSFGRSGSTLLTRDIFYITSIHKEDISDIAEANSSSFLKTYTTGSPIHSHYLHTADDISKFTCFFSLRKNPVNTILSNIFTKQFNVWHTWQHETVNTSPFTFDLWEDLDSYCLGLIKWCNHYTPILNSSHQVVYYEDYVKTISVNQEYKETYPNKKSLLINYEQVIEYILKFKDNMLSAQAPFAELVTT